MTIRRFAALAVAASLAVPASALGAPAVSCTLVAERTVGPAVSLTPPSHVDLVGLSTCMTSTTIVIRVQVDDLGPPEREGSIPHTGRWVIAFTANRTTFTAETARYVVLEGTPPPLWPDARLDYERDEVVFRITRADVARVVGAERFTVSNVRAHSTYPAVWAFGSWNTLWQADSIEG